MMLANRLDAGPAALHRLPEAVAPLRLVIFYVSDPATPFLDPAH
jgi:hypothetical protein